jgi:hypothetical protein
MNETIVPQLFAPEGGWKVRIIDLSGAELEDDGVVEEISGFPTLMQANEFARRYVRDSIERCRAPGAKGDPVLELWRAFGEDAQVVDAGEGAWRAEPELAEFAATRARGEDRNWRALDPRGDSSADDDDDDDSGFDDIDEGENDEEFT